MKNLLFIIAALFCFTAFSSSEVSAQCSSEQLTDACIPKLQNGYTFLKSYQIDGKDGAKNKVEYSYVFTKGAQYMINICSEGQGTDGIVVTLYDSNRKKMVSSLVNGQYISAIAYPCNNTGIYYITFTFDDSNKYCGGSVLGFKR
ncbi:hypothetical protein AB9P05_13710 [Roseivirga sp. BDSF3-8]|uniref:hypothetical protein n=1 Tax=Roseivirga sp. BDSF3-8 TaxID=3241598 RepID=UPI003531C380